jgi:exodeoxyribonuclease VII small subunit
MSTDTLTYDIALKELQNIVNDLQEEALGIDQLSDKVKRAAVLIQFCKEKLRSTEDEVKNLL